ncbi:hypothetical protein A7Q09_10220 [Methylacidiphilum sp. Yel]|jgi:hypothetical protein|uniref:hypothetical protein n=1 Tax=Methylacidiphilum sp. Yel TaxID=1847730 RepID=UPI00106D93D0|nr:hypothetical protein [Methylacidiphilum sp. Yel]TFE66323.1 hypothetical protein A7Q09_10220 [Methylacidiphilum sp. Yel]
MKNILDLPLGFSLFQFFIKWCSNGLADCYSILVITKKKETFVCILFFLAFLFSFTPFLRCIGLTIGEDEGVLLKENPDEKERKENEKKLSGFFVAGFVGPQWIRSSGGHIEGGNSKVILNNDFSTILSPTFGYYWYNPEKLGHFSFTLELTSAYNGSLISVHSGPHSYTVSTDTGLVFLFGTVGYRLRQWEPIIGLGSGIGILAPQGSGIQIVPTALMDVGMRYHWTDKWSLRIESFFGWLGSSRDYVGNREISSIQYFSNNIVVGIGYALGNF